MHGPCNPLDYSGCRVVLAPARLTARRRYLVNSKSPTCQNRSNQAALTASLPADSNNACFHTPPRNFRLKVTSMRSASGFIPLKNSNAIAA